jgi:hypothetical protein
LCTKTVLQHKLTYWQNEAFATVDAINMLDEQARIASGIEYSNICIHKYSFSFFIFKLDL